MENAPQLPTSALAPVVSPIPFVIWGIDLVGKLPRAKGGAEFAIVAVDYFRKWVGAAPLKKTKSEDVIQFLWKNILTRFGIRKILVSDNGPQFEGQKVVGLSTYELEDLDGNAVPRTWHASKLCKYYV
ncbi:hypothetical protein LIER_18984 [Lithospermum erythrorhizon]|uniref:Integrase catalytic domain-containing protein n=1 Tax=Lithospermum erythrorhizon TaxID=34254 RepID=A0AAV3QIZ1_LITER